MIRNKERKGQKRRLTHKYLETSEIIYGDLSEKETKVLEYIRITGLTSSSDIQKHFDMEQKPVSRIITKLKEKRCIVSEGKARNTMYKVDESRQESGQIVLKLHLNI